MRGNLSSSCASPHPVASTSFILIPQNHSSQCPPCKKVTVAPSADQAVAFCRLPLWLWRRVLAWLLLCSCSFGLVRLGDRGSNAQGLCPLLRLHQRLPRHHAGAKSLPRLGSRNSLVYSLLLVCSILLGLVCGAEWGWFLLLLRACFELAPGVSIAEAWVGTSETCRGQ